MEITLRDVKFEDLDIFFGHQQDIDAQQMAAFVHKNPSDRGAFDSHWNRIMGSETVLIKSILNSKKLVGHIAKFESGGNSELTYWIDRAYWGKGVTTKALKLFLEVFQERPVYARAAKDNIGSCKVLEKCGFTVFGYDKYYANARRKEIKEVIMVLKVFE